MSDKKKEDELKSAEKPAEQKLKKETLPPETDAQDGADEVAKPVSESAEEPNPQAAPEKGKQPAEPDWKDQYARLLADFDNYKKRALRDREDTYRYAEADILNDILPTVDNLALALTNNTAAEDPFVKGVQLVYDTLLKALKDHGAEPFDSLGKALDPNTMEAIATLPSPDVAEGLVSNEVKRGWTLKGKLLRAAQVVVSSGLPDKS